MHNEDLLARAAQGKLTLEEKSCSAYVSGTVRRLAAAALERQKKEAKLKRDMEFAISVYAGAMAETALAFDRLERAEQRAEVEGAPTQTATPAAESKGDH